MSAQKYLIWITIGCLITLISIASFNYKVDPAQLFSNGKYEKGIAEILNHGMNVADCSNYDERLMQRHYVELLKVPKEVIVLGSSRTMLIRANMFPGKTFFNHSVSGATLEDYMAIYEMHYEKGFKPKIVVLGIDPWVFNRVSGEHQWESLSHEYQFAAQRLGIQTNISSEVNPLKLKYMELFSFAYFKESINTLINNMKGPKKGDYYPTQDSISDVNIKLADGSIIYDNLTRERSSNEVTTLAIDYATKQPVYLLENYLNLDPKRKMIFEAFIKSLQRDDIEVIIYLPPYHPITYSMLINNEKYKIIDNAQEYIVNFADSNHIRVVGSYNPSECKCSEEDFFDGMHTNEQGSKKAFSNNLLISK